MEEEVELSLQTKMIEIGNGSSFDQLAKSELDSVQEP